MELKQASNGDINLFIWREGHEYFRQKSKVFLKEFTTLIFDLRPQPPASPMIYHDLTKGLPFPDASFDHVNCYHVYEHLNFHEADILTREIRRVLKPGGIYRASTPNMEMIAAEYLKNLESCLDQETEANLKRYRWIVMKLIEQGIRDKTGGLMLETMQQGGFDRRYVRDVFGEAHDSFFDIKPQAQEAPPAGPALKRSLLKKVFSLNQQKIKNKINDLKYRKQLARYQNGIGADMRTNRETVTLLPDRLYLQLNFERNGFTDFTVRDYKTSLIRDWDKYKLDQSNNGEYAYDPSLYVEARKEGGPDGN